MILSNPLINDKTAPAASFLKAFLNCSPLIPATVAKLFKLFPPCTVARFIFDNNVEKAVPPASASIPTELNAAENDMICASDKPT